MSARHRLVFTGVWLTGVGALLCYPGFELKSLARGLIVGYWPVGAVIEAFAHPLVTFAGMFVLSGLSVWACAWLMDRARLPRGAWIVLSLAVLAGLVAGYDASPDRFNAWTRSPVVSAATESPEVGYEPTKHDFRTRIVFPTAVASGLWGLYTAAAGCAAWSLTRAPTHRKSNSPPRLRSDTRG